MDTVPIYRTAEDKLEWRRCSLPNEDDVLEPVSGTIRLIEDESTRELRIDFTTGGPYRKSRLAVVLRPDCFKELAAKMLQYDARAAHKAFLAAMLERWED